VAEDGHRDPRVLRDDILDAVDDSRDEGGRVEGVPVPRAWLSASQTAARLAKASNPNP
jgi:hypothetical protein